MSAWTVIRHIELDTGAAASILLDNIPSTYTDLYLFWSHRNTGTETQARIKINGDAGSNYPKRWLTYDNGAASSYTDSSNFPTWTSRNNFTANTFASTAFYFTNYAGSTIKSFSVDSFAQNNSSTNYGLIGSFIWNNTAAINSIELYMAANDISQYSSATLYGITKGSSGGVTVS